MIPRGWRVQGLAVSAFVLALASPGWAQPTLEWTAFNDLNAWGTDSDDAPHVTLHSYQTSGGVLKRFADGADLAVTVTGSVVGGYDPKSNGGDVAPGTDAATWLSAPAGAMAVDMAGIDELDGAGWQSVVTFEGLDPAKTYGMTLSANRGSASYAGARFTRVTITGADAYTNESSAGVVTHSESSVSFGTGYNTINGYVARWTGIQAADGRFAVISQWNPDLGFGFANVKGYAMSAFRLDQYGTPAPSCENNGECDDQDPCTTDICDGICTHAFNSAPCDDGVPCTGGDICNQGLCEGTDICPNPQVCDLEIRACVGGGPSVTMSAYNDLAWSPSQLADRITIFTSPSGGSGLPSHGEMVDHASGEGVGITLTVTGGTYNGGGHANDGRNPPEGTDAFEIFGGIVATRGAIAYVNQPASPLVLTFGGLDPAELYNLALVGDRGDYGWTRASMVTLSGADSFINQSSVAADNPALGSGGALFSGPDDDGTRLPADNPNGYVARFVDVASGADGTVALIIEADGTIGYRGKYASAVMLQQVGPSGGCDTDCDDGNPCTDDHCDYGQGVCIQTPQHPPVR